MAASNLYMNWTGVTVQPPSPATLISLTEVTEVDVERGGEVKKWFADAAVFPLALGLKNKTRKVTIKGGAINKLASVPENVPCTITGILNDFNNGTGAGAITVTAANAVVTSNPFKGMNNEFSTADLEFECYSSDGITDPVTYVVAS